jgi:hypothetical protein
MMYYHLNTWFCFCFHRPSVYKNSLLDKISFFSLSRLMQQLFTLLVILVVAEINGDPGDFRPPAVPLIVFSPHVSGKRN